MSDVSRILSQIESGDPQAAEQLLPLVYDELRKLAAAKLAHEKPSQTLQATALVHEAYLRLVGSDGPEERARRRASLKHGGHLQRQDLNTCEIEAPQRSVDLLALDEALVRLAALDPRKADLVKLRYFAGLTIREAAAALDIAESTADADWAYAKSWLRLEIGG
jgi:DNA-directed RNA polymerase specialized sigma24 family protein